MNKMDEQVVVFPCRVLNHLTGLPGIAEHKNNPDNLMNFTEKVVPTLRLMRRGDVEDDPSTLQLIPYVVIESSDEKRILIYDRGDKGGEKRLANKWSIGLGGHINAKDCETVPFKKPGGYLDFIRHAAFREIQEEIANWTVQEVMRFWAFLYDDSTAVNSVHFGCVLLLTYYGDAEKLVAKSEIATLKWINKSALKFYELESWSEMVRDNLIL